MTITGAGGVKIDVWRKSIRFFRDYRKLDFELSNLVDAVLQDLLKYPIPSGLEFEKLKGYANPDIYTIHVTGNYKVSMEIEGTKAFLRRVADHNEIDRTP